MPGQGRPRSWSDDDLRRAVVASLSWADVCRALDLFVNAKNTRRVRQRAWELHVSAEHFQAPDGRPRPRPPMVVEGSAAERRSANRRPATRRWSDDDLRRAVGAAYSWAGVHRELGIAIGGTTYRLLQERAGELGLSTSHFTGKGWSGGRTRPVPVRQRPLEDVLVSKSDYRSTYWLKRRLLSAGLREERCERCGLNDWCGGPLPLELDHINGDRRDNRLENLRILCPNCHSQTATYRGRNVGRYHE